MKKFTKHTPEQIVRKLEQAKQLKDDGATTAQVLAELHISEATLHRWQSIYGDMSRSQGS